MGSCQHGPFETMGHVHLVLVSYKVEGGFPRYKFFFSHFEFYKFEFYLIFTTRYICVGGSYFNEKV